MGVETAITPAIKSEARIAQFPSQLQHHVAAQRKAGQEDRRVRVGSWRITASRSEVWPE